MSSSSQDLTSTAKPVAVFSCQNSLNQDTFPIETDFPQDINRFLEISSDPLLANVAKSLLDGIRRSFAC